MDFSCTLLNGAAFYKQPKNFKILPAHCVPVPPLWQRRWAAGGGHPYTSFFPTSHFPHCYPVTANQGQVTPLPHRNSFEELALA